MNIDYAEIGKYLKDNSIEAPQNTQLSGHVTGELFEKKIYGKLKAMYPNNVYKQFEFLNYLYLKNPDSKSFEERVSLISSSLISNLINRSYNEVTKWSSDNQFKEKQNDTSDILIYDNPNYNMLDVKTRNIDKKAQPPNIISALKLAKAMKIMLDTKEFDTLDLVYLEVDWSLCENYLKTIDIHTKSLFKTDPSKLYINWAAGLQIQFHVADLPQDFKGSKKEWAKAYLKHFYSEAIKHSNSVVEKYAKPFEEYSK